MIGRSKLKKIGPKGEGLLRIKLNPIGKRLLRGVGELPTRVAIETSGKLRLLRSLITLVRR